MIGGDHLGALLPVADAFDAVGAKHYLVGGLASSVTGMPRSTVDVDIVVDLRGDQVAPLTRALEDAYYIDEEAVRAAVAKRGSFNLLRLDTMTKVDVYVAGSDAYARGELARATPRTLVEGERQINVQSPEDSVLRKLLWYRQGREVSERQWHDIVGVMRIQGDRLDREYLRHWALHHRIADLLARAYMQAAEPPEP